MTLLHLTFSCDICAVWVIHPIHRCCSITISVITAYCSTDVTVYRTTVVRRPVTFGARCCYPTRYVVLHSFTLYVTTHTHTGPLHTCHTYTTRYGCYHAHVLPFLHIRSPRDLPTFVPTVTDAVYVCSFVGCYRLRVCARTFLRLLLRCRFAVMPAARRTL